MARFMRRTWRKASLISFLSPEPLYANEISEARAQLVSQVVREDAIISVGDGRESLLTLVQFLLTCHVRVLARYVDVQKLDGVALQEIFPNLAKLQYELAAHAIEILPSGRNFRLCHLLTSYG
jgi:hypothetical protein